MARFIETRLNLSDTSPHCVSLGHDWVSIESLEEEENGPVVRIVNFCPETRESANRMSAALKLAAKRLEDMGRGLQ